MKSLIILSGVPASGKTTWADKYSKENKNSYILSLDEIRFEVTKAFNDFSKQDEVWSKLDKRVKDLSKNKDVNIIIDALNHKNEYRLEYIKMYPQFDNYVLVIFNKKPKDILHFNKCREEDKWVNEEDIKRLFNAFEYPSKEVIDKYNEVLFINDYV